MSERYCPSNGTEGEGFIGKFCENCERDADYRERDIGNGCDILARSLAYDVKHERFPDEWTYDADGMPTCTAFVPEGGKVPTDVELEASGQVNLLDML